MKTGAGASLGIAIAMCLGAAGAVRAETRVEKELRLEPGGSFTLKTDLGWVKVKGTNRPGARVVVSTDGQDINDLLRFEFQEGPGSVTVIAKKRHRDAVFSFGHRSLGFQVEVPAKTRVNVDTSGGSISLGSLAAETNLETSGGGIAVRDHEGDVHAHTSGGSIDLARVKGRCRVDTSGGGIEASAIEGAIEADTSGGSIEMDRVSGDIHAHSSGGGIQIREAGGRVEADTSGGSVEASFARGNARGGSLESSGGGVSVAVDPRVGLAIDASGSSVQTDLPIKVSGEISRRHLRGVMGNGGETLRVRTSGGSVQIRPL